MKQAIIILMCISSVNGLCQTAPIQVGNYKIGTTHLYDLPIDFSFKYHTKIDSESSFNIYTVEPDDSMFNFSDNIYEVISDDDTSSLSWNKVAPYCDQCKTYLIPQLQIEDYIVNNLLLFFHYGTLVKFTYSSSAKLTDLLIEKYRHQGTKVQDKTYSSKCKNRKSGKFLTNQILQFSFTDTTTMSMSFLTLYTGVTSGCELYDYISVTCYDINLGSRYEEEMQKAFKQKKLDIIEAAKKRKAEALKNF